VAAQLAASQEGLSSMKLINWSQGRICAQLIKHHAKKTHEGSGGIIFFFNSGL
jgi:hypothetical protein